MPNQNRSIQGLVRHDLTTRESLGIQRYGTPLQAGNGRDALRDAYEEALDLACYLRQAIEERDNPPKPQPSLNPNPTTKWEGLRLHLVREHGQDIQLVSDMPNSDVVQAHLDVHRLNMNTHTYVAWGSPEALK